MPVELAVIALDDRETQWTGSRGLEGQCWEVGGGERCYDTDDT